jgi:hypothetical protein
VYCINVTACDDSPVYGVVRQTGKNLTGVLPSWNGDHGQGALPKLQVLALTDNPGLTGTLPDAWGGMTEMTKLYLYKNNLDGSLPASWGGMTKMTTLYLQYNHLDVTTVPKSWDKMTQMTDRKLRPQLTTVRCEPQLRVNLTSRLHARSTLSISNRPPSPSFPLLRT